MFQRTVDRVCDATMFTTPVVVGSDSQADAIEQQLAATHAAAARKLILEPCARNTAPAIALAALAAEPHELLLVMPSDHLIGDDAAFAAAVAKGAALADAGWLVTFGVHPSRPETGYGYIKRGEEIVPGVARVDSFVEKPDRDTAEAYLATGRYSWNGGIFLFGAGTYLDALERHAPEMLAAVRSSMESATRDPGRIFPERHAFASSPGQAVDYAVMEKADKVAVVPVEMGWSDVGSWDALHAISEQDEAGNTHHGEIFAIDTKGCMIRSEGPVVAAVGVSDLIVIATPDAVLIMPRGASQEVKRAVEALKEDGHITLDRAL
jgi:mannose-1-phosphate guanylyltransferase/mannose-1-phosphate guanylyltransferase/mannose-6-phosphate isomerase